MSDQKNTILIVDDNPDILKALRIVLETGSYKVVEAATAAEGVKVFQESDPDLIIVDMMMESMDAGINFVKELQGLNNTVPVYMLSSAGDAMADNADYDSLGLSGIFQKPIENDVLLTVVKSKLA